MELIHRIGVLLFLNGILAVSAWAENAEPDGPSPYEFQVKPGSANWTTEMIAWNQVADTSTLRITEKSSRRLIQEIPLEYSVDALPSGVDWIAAADYDFDGYKDLAITIKGGSGGNPMLIIRFDPVHDHFRPPVRLPNASPNEEKRLVDIGWNNGACCFWEEEVRFVPGKAEPIVMRHVERAMVDDEGKGQYLGGIQKFLKGKDSGLIRLKVEERDSNGQMRVVCLLKGIDSDTPPPTLLQGDRDKCPSFYREL